MTLPLGGFAFTQVGASSRKPDFAVPANAKERVAQKSS